MVAHGVFAKWTVHRPLELLELNSIIGRKVIWRGFPDAVAAD